MVLSIIPKRKQVQVHKLYPSGYNNQIRFFNPPSVRIMGSQKSWFGDPEDEPCKKDSQTIKPLFLESPVILRVRLLHPGRLTWNLQITQLERKIIFQTSMIMFHVNLPGCNSQLPYDLEDSGALNFSPISRKIDRSKAIPQYHCLDNGGKTAITLPSTSPKRVFPKMVVPQNGWFTWKTLLKWMIGGETHYFRKHLKI